MPFSAAESKLVSIFIQTLLYGAYTVLFCITCWVLVNKRPRGRPINRLMFSTAIIMFILATMHIGINYARVIKAFIVHSSEPGGPGVFFNQLAEFTQVFGSAIYVAQTLVGDTVVLLRAYLVWGKRFDIIAFPCLLLLGSTVTGGGILYSMAKVEPDSVIFVIELSQWIVSFFVMTLVTNVIGTGLVAYRLWCINRRSLSFSEDNLHPIMLLVIESGAIYSAALITLLILYLTKSWFQYVLLDAMSPVVGIVFSMIIVRIGLGLTSGSGQSEEFGHVSTFHPTIPGNFVNEFCRPHPADEKISTDFISVESPITGSGSTSPSHNRSTDKIDV